MVTELPQRDFRVVRPLLGPDFAYPEALSVVEGTNPGWVFTDDSASPRTALIWSKGIEGFYLVGIARNSRFLTALDAFVDRVVTPRAMQLGLRWFEVNGADESWGPVIEKTFRARKIHRSAQVVFRMPEVDQDPPAHEDDRGVRFVDEDLLHDRSIENRAFLRSKIESYWESTDAYLQAGIGCCVVQRNQIVSLCFSAFVAGCTHVVDIETIPEFRRRRVAERVGRAYADACRARSLTLHWDCMRDNAPSMRLAEKLGLRKVREYALYSFRLSE